MKFEFTGPQKKTESYTCSAQARIEERNAHITTEKRRKVILTPSKTSSRTSWRSTLAVVIS